MVQATRANASRKGGKAMETTDNNTGSTRGEGRPARPLVDAPSLDLAKYRDLVGDAGVPDEDMDEYLRTLWDIMSGFVHNAWDVRVIPAFLPEIFDGPSDDGGGAVDSDDEEDADDEA
jgi:hypothetical protein